MTASSLAVGPLGVLLVGVLLTYVAAAASVQDAVAGWVASLVCAIAFATTVGLATGPLPRTASVLGSEGAVAVTHLGVLVAGIATFVGALVCVASVRFLDAGQETYYPLVVALVAGVVGIGFAADMFTLYLSFELLAVASYALVPFRLGRERAVAAGTRYLLMNVVGSVLAIVGISLVYDQSGGVLAFDALGSTLVAAEGQLVDPLAVAVLLLVVGFGVKAAIVPLHAWLPDAYTEAPAAVSALLAGVATPAALVAIVKCLAVFPGSIPSGLLLVGFGVVTMTVGNLLALRQRELKRLLAYSSIPHIGYIVVGLGVGLYGGGVLAFDGAFFHILANALMKGGAFLAVGAILYRLRRTDSDNPGTMDSLAGVGYRMPIAAGALVVGVLALAGVPPLAGFWGKLFIVVASAEVAGTAGIVLALVVVANSFLSLGYYLPLLRSLFASGDESLAPLRPSPRAVAVPLVAVTTLTIVVGLVPMSGFEIVHPAAEAMADALTGVSS